MDKEHELKLKIARANLEATKEQTKSIVEAISKIEFPDIKIPDINLDMTETNKVLEKIVNKLDEDLTIELVIK